MRRAAAPPIRTATCRPLRAGSTLCRSNIQLYITEVSYFPLDDDADVTIKKGDAAIGETAPAVDDVLTVSGDATDLIYEWFVGGESQGTAAAGNTSYTVKAADVGKVIKIKAYQTKGAIDAVKTKAQKDEEAEKAVVMHRLYNSNSGEHFYAANDEERDHLVSLGWNSEGEAWTAPATSATPVYRLYNPYEPLGAHHYTTSKDEYDACIAAGWIGEDIGWYSDDAKGQAVLRVYNPNAYATGLTGAHHYTVNAGEAQALVAIGWVDEQIGWCGI